VGKRLSVAQMIQIPRLKPAIPIEKFAPHACIQTALMRAKAFKWRSYEGLPAVIAQVSF